MSMHHRYEESSVAMHTELEVLETSAVKDEGGEVEDPYLEAQRLVRQRTSHAALEAMYTNVKKIEKKRMR